MDYVDALKRLIVVVELLQQNGQHILHASTSKYSQSKLYVHIKKPVDGAMFFGRDAKVVRKSINLEYIVNMDGVDVCWLEPIKDEPEERTVTL